MKRDWVFKLFLGLLGLYGILHMFTGKLIVGGAMVVVAGALYYITTGTKKGDDQRQLRNIKNRTNMTIEEIHELFKDMDTPIGKCWIGGHKWFFGDCVIFGPGPFKDYIAIGLEKDGRNIVMKSGFVLDKLVPKAGDEWRLEQIIDTSKTEVNADSYAMFAGQKMVNSILLDNIAFYIDEYMDGVNEIPSTLDAYKVYHYNSGDSIVRDVNGNEYGKMSTVYEPLSIIMYDHSGKEIGFIVANGENGKGGYNVAVNDKMLGTMYCDTSSKKDEYVLDTGEHEIRLISFPVTREANLSCNYIVAIDGVQQAALGANLHIKLTEDPDANSVENEIICAFDEEFLHLYFLLADFMLTKNTFIR